jgi:hypothetical protein
VEQVVPTYHPAENSVKERRETNSAAECLAQTV